MLPNFLQSLIRRTDADYEQAFVREIHVGTKRIRDPKIERLIWICWILILAKSALVWWACEKYNVPVDPLWVIVPTVVFAVLCTCIYFGRR